MAQGISRRKVRFGTLLLGCSATFAAFAGGGQQTDIIGPAGSVSFGASVAVLPNGNIVVADPDGPVSGVGAVYLYAPDGTMISWLTGTSADDHVGSGGIVVLKSGNFVVLSPHWHNQDAVDAGAVTWGDGTFGVFGVVTPGNSLVGSTKGDAVGTAGSVTALANGNYVLATPAWTNPGIASAARGGAVVTPTIQASAGAATWGDGGVGSSGAISSANSLVGVQANDNVGIGGVSALPNGNYVVDSFAWNNVAITQAGAVTLGDGVAGISGAVSAANSLVGSSAGDFVGARSVAIDPMTGAVSGSTGITVLPNNNKYVVVSYAWANGAFAQAGAASFADGVLGLSGTITAANSLIGAHSNDHIGSAGVEVLSNGNYVVDSPDCANVSAARAGAVTWSDGNTGLTGYVTPANSLVGTQANDAVGGGTVIGLGHHVTPLADGNYVVISSAWSNGANSMVGAVTWVDGSKPQPSIVSAANSLVGTTPGDQAGASGVVALPNGDYVVDSLFWSNGPVSNAGAATLLRGGHRTSASISAGNSLVGSSANDFVGIPGAVVLSSGNFVVGSEAWHNAGAQVGAVTWVDASVGASGPVSAASSLTGSADGDQVGVPTALSDGNYAVAAGFWSGVGAVTWGNGMTGISGLVSAANSMVGSQANDHVGFRNAIALPGGVYLTENLDWNNGALQKAGAISLGNAGGGTIGPVTPGNSVIGNVANAGITLVHDYDSSRGTLIVGKPAENIVTLFTYFTDRIFADGFE